MLREDPIDTNSDELMNEIEREDEIQPAIYAFNRRPRRGISALCLAHHLPETPQTIAQLLHKVPGLLGSKIGEYLSQRENAEILTEYFNQVDLRGDFLTALRKGLNSSLHLPGEAEQIDRIVQGWASCWVNANPNSHLTDETAYMLAFGVVMLNSDLHNPHVKHRMTAQTFVSNLRGVLAEESIGDGELIEIYESIRMSSLL
jgi:brefeldin A-inhibited guanine nucleotide-exchange protein